MIGRVAKAKVSVDLWSPLKLPLLLLILCVGVVLPQAAKADVDDIFLETTGVFSGSATGSDLERTYTSTTVSPGSLINANGFIVIAIAIHDKRWSVKSSGVVWGTTTVGTSAVQARACGACTDPSPATEIWGIAIGTSSPSGTISVTLNTTTSDLPDPEIAFTYYVFTNVAQTSTWGANTGNESSGTTDALLSVGAVNRSVGIAVGAVDSTTITASITDATVTQETSRMNLLVGDLRAFGSTMTRVGFNVASEFTLSASARWAGSLISINPATTPTAVRLSKFQAVTTPAGVKVRWRTSSEVSNLGFNVYREENGIRTRVNRALIAGSALMVGPGTELSAGRGYEWVDRAPLPDASVRYWLEAIDLDGSTRLLDPVSPETERAEAGSRQQKYAEAVLLDTLGHGAPESVSEAGISARSTLEMPRSDSNIALSKDGRSEQAIQWMLAASPGAKIGVTREGWYRVTRSALMAAGYDPGGDSKYLQLFADGVEQPIMVREGADAAIEFYGTPVDTPYSGTRTYWLVKGSTPGLRIARFDSRRSRPSTLPSFPFIVERKERTIYFAALTNNGDASNFFGPVVSATPASQKLTLANLDATAQGSWPLQIVLQGVTKDIAHVVEVLVNGNSAGFVRFKDQERQSSVLSVPRTWLVEGANEVSLVARGEKQDVSLVDTVRLTYPHKLTADQGALKLTAQAGAPVTIDGFPDDSVRLMDITDSAEIIELPATTSKTMSGFGVSTTLPSRGRFDRTILAFTSSRILTPASLTANQPSAWHSDAAKADLVILSNRAFFGAARDLQLRRQQGGLTVKLVDVDDVYDEISFGIEEPYAIRTFLQKAAADWGTRYVLLVGDATSDPRNYLGLNSLNSVPSKFVATELLKTASDDWFVDFNGDGFPELSVGRLAVKTEAEAATVVAKIAAFEDSVKASAPWLQRVVHVADEDDSPETNPFSFEKAVSDLSALVPPSIGVDSIRIGQLGMPAAHDSVVSRLNQGALLYTYVGHGTQDSWSKFHVFDAEDGSTLTNGGRLPVIVTMNCLNGLFADANADSLAEVLQKSPSGGGAAIWASSALTNPNGQGVLARTLYSTLFASPGVRLGDATLAAKAAVNDSDVRRTWILFGDPTMKIR